VPERGNAFRSACILFSFLTVAEWRFQSEIFNKMLQEEMKSVKGERGIRTSGALKGFLHELTLLREE